MARERKKVRQTQVFYIYDASLMDIETAFEEFAEKWDVEVNDVKLEVEYDYDNVDINLVCDRLETAKEYERAVKREMKTAEKAAITKAKKLEDDKKLYEKLKKKFG